MSYDAEAECHEDEPAGLRECMTMQQIAVARRKLEAAGWKIRGTWYEENPRGDGEFYAAAQHIPYKFLRRFRWQPNGEFWQQYVENGRGRWSRID